MVKPQLVLDGLATGIKNSGMLPTAVTYATLELNQTGAHANVSPPILELTLADLVRDRSRNTEQIGFETDSNGNHIGRIYRTWFEMTVQIDVIAAEGSSYDSRTLTDDVRDALVQYDSYQLDALLPDPDGTGVLGDVTRVVVGDQEIVNNLSQTPAMRRVRLFAECWFHDDYKSSTYEGPADYIKDVRTPDDADVVADSTTSADIDATTSDDP